MNVSSFISIQARLSMFITSLSRGLESAGGISGLIPDKAASFAAFFLPAEQVSSVKSALSTAEFSYKLRLGVRVREQDGLLALVICQ